MKFKPIELEDKAIIESFTYRYNLCNCDLAFSNMYAWRNTYHTAWTIVDNFLIIRFYVDGSHRIAYLQPLGDGDFTHLIPLLEKDAKTNGQCLRITDCTPEGVAMIRRTHPEFGFWDNRDLDDYVYNASDLRNLEGRRYQQKRNHINKFEDNYKYEYHPLTAEMIEECLHLECEWCSNRSDKMDKLSAEQLSIRLALENFDALHLIGGTLYVDDKMIAFTYGSAINDNSFDTHVEKVNTAYDGVFPVINKLFTKHLPENFIYINREEDLGIEGLRKSKQSYHPAFLQKKIIGYKFDKRQVRIKALWKDVFGDDDLIIEQYLINHYSPCCTFTHSEGDVIVAMVHFIPIGDVAYIYAVATAVEYRDRGLCADLMQKALNFARKKGLRMAALIPQEEWLKKYYAQFGFVDTQTPVTFNVWDGYDFGTGNTSKDIAMTLCFDDTKFTDESLVLNILEDIC